MWTDGLWVKLTAQVETPRPDLVFEESPQHTYQFKRLSVAAPKYGPTLKISPSAERYIMGNEEDLLLNKMKTRELEDQLNSKPSSSETPVCATKKDIERPPSSQGLSRLSSRVGLIDPKASTRFFEEKKADEPAIKGPPAKEYKAVKPVKAPTRSEPPMLQQSPNALPAAAARVHHKMSENAATTAV
ncbi:hypothetical protein JMJ35_000364 [Cladonia borealis]|uniref:Uncharacterized protein n=1 Tax=Cladonia borealis TaxID=184061 RepID=A0AA39RB52_9LECA|nr:hypothetical protein JMJ35_000364 [Cladonia borealis]